MGNEIKREPLCDDLAGEGCGLKKVLNIVGGKWKIMILCVIDNNKIVRYGDLKRSVFGITNTMLAQSLKELERAEMVVRTQYDEMPVRVEYSLTEKAKSLIPILLELKRWGENNLQMVNFHRTYTRTLSFLTKVIFVVKLSCNLKTTSYNNT